MTSAPASRGGHQLIRIARPRNVASQLDNQDRDRNQQPEVGRTQGGPDMPQRHAHGQPGPEVQYHPATHQGQAQRHLHPRQHEHPRKHNQDLGNRRHNNILARAV